MAGWRVEGTRVLEKRWGSETHETAFPFWVKAAGQTKNLRALMISAWSVASLQHLAWSAVTQPAVLHPGWEVLPRLPLLVRAEQMRLSCHPCRSTVAMAEVPRLTCANTISRGIRSKYVCCVASVNYKGARSPNSAFFPHIP